MLLDLSAAFNCSVDYTILLDRLDRNLGVIMVSDLHFDSHIKIITKSAYYHLINLARLKHVAQCLMPARCDIRHAHGHTASI